MGALWVPGYAEGLRSLVGPLGAPFRPLHAQIEPEARLHTRRNLLLGRCPGVANAREARMRSTESDPLVCGVLAVAAVMTAFKILAVILPAVLS